MFRVELLNLSKRITITLFIFLSFGSYVVYGSILTTRKVRFSFNKILTLYGKNWTLIAL
jgi:hypothetical protein